LLGELEHLKIKTRLIDEMFASVHVPVDVLDFRLTDFKHVIGLAKLNYVELGMGEYVFLK
jgi:hypothetical protein